MLNREQNTSLFKPSVEEEKLELESALCVILVRAVICLSLIRILYFIWVVVSGTFRFLLYHC